MSWKIYKASCFDKFKKGELEQFTDDIVDNYQRFMGKTTDLLKRNVEEYLKAKGCNEDVSVAVKQLDVSVLFSQLNNNTDNRCKEINVYTAFRDSRTYFNKGRQETWKSTYKIHKNSAFLNSVDREYYIFNYFDRAMIENGIYKNENNIFYNQYNCGVTCSIYSCINGERKLFGYLACDSLINVKKKKKYENVYDWHIAVMTMLVANIIALYLQNFEDIWTQVHGSNNFCAYMAERVKKTRYGE